MTRWLVLGCGPSLSLLEGREKPPDVRVIGVHYCGYALSPPWSALDAFYVHDVPASFRPNREAWCRFTAYHRASQVYVHTSSFSIWKFRHAKCHNFETIRVGSGRRAPVTNARPYGSTHMSVLPAIGIAAHFGKATDIGVLGVDLTGHPKLEKKKPEMDTACRRMAEYMGQLGVTVRNLSPTSMLEGWQKADLDEWLG